MITSVKTELGMETVVDLAESRKAKSEKSKQLRQAAKELLTLLEQQRQDISEEFIAFLLAMAISDQALHYVEKAQQWQAGELFIENLVATTRQLFEANGPLERRPASTKTKPESPPGQLLSFAGEQSDHSKD
jgi:hypothetical protein